MTKRGPTRAKKWQPLTYAGPGPIGEVFENDRYVVVVQQTEAVTALMIRTRTWSAVGAHDWRVLMKIKDELCGPEREACELYPAQSRLYDTSNCYWLFVLPEGERFPFGADERKVIDTPESIAREGVGGMQRAQAP